MRKRIISLILTLMLAAALSLSVRALEVPDYDRRGSISISMSYQNAPVSGGTLTLYRVADVVNSDADYSFAYTSDFAGCSIPVEDLNDAKLPEELSRIAGEKGLAGTTLTVDGNGKALFSDLELGLYLVVQETAASGFKRINPFLVSVPYQADGRYLYDVDTAPKNIPGPEVDPTEPPVPTEPADPELPQTGQTNWPIPVMAVLGMLLIITGCCVCASGRKCYEA